MAPRTESCEFEGCVKTFTFETTAEYVALLQTHMAAMHPAADQCVCHASQGLLSGAGSGSGGGTVATGGARVVNQERRRDRQQKVPQKKCTNCRNPWCKGGDRCGAREKGHVSSRCPKKASAVEQSEDSDSGDAGDRVSDSAIFISGNKRNTHYPSVSIKQAASPQSLAEGKNRTCSVINGSRGGRRSTKDGFRGGATKEPPPRDCTWAETLGNVMKVMVGATIATTTTSPATLHHHTFDVVSQRWKRGPGEGKRYQSVEVTVDKPAMVDSLGKYFPTGGYMRPRVALDRGLVDTTSNVRWCSVAG